MKPQQVRANDPLKQVTSQATNLKVKPSDSAANAAQQVKPETPFPGLTRLAALTFEQRWNELRQMNLEKAECAIGCFVQMFRTHPALTTEAEAADDMTYALNMLVGSTGPDGLLSRAQEWINELDRKVTGGFPDMAANLEGIADLLQHSKRKEDKDAVSWMRLFCSGLERMEASPVLKWVKEHTA